MTLLFAVQIIDNIIEESQKANRLEEDPLGEDLADPLLHPNTWSSGADLLQHIPELLVAETGSHGHNAEPSTETNKADSGQVLPPTHSVLEHQEGDGPSGTTEVAGETPELGAGEADASEEGSKAADTGSVRQADVLEQTPSDSSPSKDSSGAEEAPPAKPPRHLTMEPDIVASTKKPGPARPPPPASGPPPRPPPPARPAPPPRKKKSDLEIEVHKIPGLEGKCWFGGALVAREA